MSNPTSLKTYIDQQSANGFFKGIAERIYLARELLCTYHDEARERQKDKPLSFVPFLSLDTITIDKVEQTEYPCDYYTISFPGIDFKAQPRKDYLEFRKEHFSNFSFCPSHLFVTKRIWGKVPSLNRDAMENVTEADLIIILGRILFNIIFCCHPYQGRKFFQETKQTNQTEKLFYDSNPGFIFDIDKNANRFINGYDIHENAWRLWNMFSDGQQTFLKDVLQGKFSSFETFFKGWGACFDFTHSQCKTPCEASIPAIVFDNYGILIFSDSCITNREATCDHVCSQLEMKCNNCKLPPDGRILNFLRVEAKVVKSGEAVFDADGKESILDLYDGKVITCDRISPAMGEEMIFSVVASKKNNILGLKYLLSMPIKAVQDSAQREYKKDEIIPLLAGVRICLFDDYEIVVPKDEDKNVASDSTAEQPPYADVGESPQNTD